VPPPTRKRASSRVACLLLSFIGLAAAESKGPRESKGIDEYELKAAFLGKFVKFVTWPQERMGERNAPFIVAVWGDDPFGRKLDDAFLNRKVEEHPINVKRFTKLEEVADAHLLFVPKREASRLDEILAQIPAAGVLVVGESTDFARDGGVVNFFIAEDKLRFEINPDSARRQGLKVSSDLLKLARIVSDRS
jgi:hypothetical protein